MLVRGFLFDRLMMVRRSFLSVELELQGDGMGTAASSKARAKETVRTESTWRRSAEPRIPAGKLMGLLAGLIVMDACLIAVDPTLERLYDRIGDGNWVLNWLAKPLNWSMDLVPLTLLVAFLAVVRAQRRTSVALATALVLQAIVVAALKHFLGRMRPTVTEAIFGTEATVFVGPSLSGGYGFPSGHAAAAFAVATVMAAAFPRFRWALFGLAACVCIARVQVDAHYFGDVFAGAVIGYYTAGGVLHFLGPFDRFEPPIRTGDLLKA